MFTFGIREIDPDAGAVRLKNGDGVCAADGGHFFSDETASRISSESYGLDSSMLVMAADPLGSIARVLFLHPNPRKVQGLKKC